MTPALDDLTGSIRVTQLAYRNGDVVVRASQSPSLPPISLTVGMPNASCDVFLSRDEALLVRDDLDRLIETTRPKAVA